ncbi:MAG: molybdenum cofactor biosynthesis protein [Thermoplasmata archaeon HGW-Thermoplasmata-1]|nr:MAG: molybdenum cofactor biosynthesis protein [Thermoplasmata archaeon HGW-Thermoplasmata-1]
MGHHEHKLSAPKTVKLAIITVSDTRNMETDTSGNTICGLLEGTGHEVVSRGIVRDERDEIAGMLKRTACACPGVQAIIINGGTGIAPRDNTLEAIAPLFEKRIPGFGELFRMLSFNEIGASAMMSRADAGTMRGAGGNVVVMALPGSTNGCRLAVERIILPELGHMVMEANK